jgi:hypothetical protein
MESYGEFTLAAETCRDVAMTVTSRSPVDSLVLSHPVRLCVSSEGPSYEGLPYYWPATRIDVP